MPVREIILKIINEFPQLSGVPIKIYNKGKLLDEKKTIADYNIGWKNNNHEVNAVAPAYMFGSQGIVGAMKI